MLGAWDRLPIAMLASQPEDVAEQILAKIRFVRFTRKTLCSREALVKSLERVRRRGYAIDDEEIESAFAVWALPFSMKTIGQSQR